MYPSPWPVSNRGQAAFGAFKRVFMGEILHANGPTDVKKALWFSHNAFMFQPCLTSVRHAFGDHQRHQCLGQRVGRSLVRVCRLHGVEPGPVAL